MMKKSRMLLAALLTCTTLAAQTNIPVGTILPVRLNATLDAKKARPGQVVTAEVMQEIPLERNSKIKLGAQVVGEVVAVTRASGASPAQLALRFGQIKIRGQVTAVRTDLRALASPLEVSQAQVPTPGDHKLPPWFWTVEQIGGDVAYRGGGPVARGVETVGTPVPGGILARVTGSPGDGCEPGNDKPQALWVFSHDVCGVYGLEAVITHDDGMSADGKFVLTSKKGNLKLRFGTGLLLQVIGVASQSPPSGDAENSQREPFGSRWPVVRLRASYGRM
jgi:hypothetical protein